jgi:RNA polymerase sigma-70 factor (ECF subfamily)
MVTSKPEDVVRTPRAPADADRPDADLIRAAASGDNLAFERLILPRLDRLLHTAMVILRHESDARDAVQDASIRAWRELGQLRDADRFDAWLGRILVNVCRNHLRSRRTTTVREVEIDDIGRDRRQPASREPAPDERVAQVDALRRAFLRLSPDERIVLGLHHGQELPIEDIAGLLGIPAGTVKWRLYAARQALARALERER